MNGIAAVVTEIGPCSDSTSRPVPGPARSIGTHAHADIHVLVHTPGEPNELWCGCDGGVFLNRDPIERVAGL